MPSLKTNADGTPHIHSYVKRTDKTMKCEDPFCTFITNKIDAKGKITLCPQCRVKSFVLTREDLRRARPACMECRKTYEAKRIKQNKEILEGLGLLSQ